MGRVVSIRPLTPRAATRLLRLASGVQASRAISRGMASGGPKIHYTHTDEAPMLATYALLPVIRRFTEPAGIRCARGRLTCAALLSCLPAQCADPQRRATPPLSPAQRRKN